MQKLAIEYLQHTVRRLPDKAALVDDTGSISFAGLWRRSLWLAQRLGAVCRKLPVVVDVEKSIDAVVAIVAVQLSGNVYVPFDPDTPPRRRQRMLSVLGDHHVLKSGAAGFTLDDTPLPPIPPDWLGQDEAERALFAALSMRKNIDPLYVIFTSGTTGTPKGVTISNAAVIDYVDWARKTYQVGEAEVIGNQAPLYFDNSVLDLYLCLGCGATLHLLPPSRFLFPADIVGYLERNHVSLIFFVPSVLSNLAAVDALAGHDLSRLSKVLFAGEAMPLATLRYLRSRLPDALLSNLYGPTEITVDAIYWIFGNELDQLEAVPLGRPCENKSIVFVSEEGRPVTEPDTVAEICVSGIGVSLGYWNDPQRSAEAFIQNPEHDTHVERIYRTGDLGYRSSRDGLIYMTGRRDSQIKHRGFRIEPGEIEHAMAGLDQVSQCCVMYDTDRQEIVAFYTAGSELPDPHALLADRLPRYMIPRRYVRLPRMPVTKNGKIDRAALWAEYRK